MDIYITSADLRFALLGIGSPHLSENRLRVNIKVYRQNSTAGECEGLRNRSFRSFSQTKS